MIIPGQMHLPQSWGRPNHSEQNHHQLQMLQHQAVTEMFVTTTSPVSYIATLSLTHLPIWVICLRLLDGKRESHVIRLLLCLLSIRLLPAHREGQLQLQLLLPVSLGPASGRMLQNYVYFIPKFPNRFQPPVKIPCGANDKNQQWLQKLANLFCSNLLCSLI